MKLQDSQSWKNIETALNAEALAYVEYVFYGQQAKKDGYVQISNLFQETADNELHHAKLLFKKLHDGGTPPTPECLKLAHDSEHYEWDVQYKEFAKVARDEGFAELGDFFDGLAAIEKSHQERFDVLAERIANDEVFKREQVQVWYCTVCGHLHIGTEAPEECPVCAHPQAYFQIRATNY
ncbi:rubrerythrin family protein [Adlercreutzia faecimuris]|uniref:Rubrerythrin family protein n=1 Tax=Adlercreutzia faecimuris TaxID=2897341 RepID=A0ABS9WJD9_9ACTN|nr:rubrerythrin family protein [Adlercreutzia sp. JBNU-10]MCI2242377.1 rubrerythrin family protein [Adlercreutzia sp. JBNU-10]